MFLRLILSRLRSGCPVGRCRWRVPALDFLVLAVSELAFVVVAL
jgi:hypothetical protein